MGYSCDMRYTSDTIRENLEEFRNDFYRVMNEMKEEASGNKAELYRFGCFHDGPVCGDVKLDLLQVLATSPYEMWLKLDAYFVKKSEKYSLFTIELFLDFIREDEEDYADEKDEEKDPEYVFCMRKFVDRVIDNFGDNDTFWYEKMDEPMIVL